MIIRVVKDSLGPIMKIAELPIPKEIIEELEKQGISSLYPPQTEAIKKGLLDGNNLVIAIPTASGKTLLALLAAVKKVEETSYKVLYLAPLRALAYEKYLEFKRFFSKLKKRTILLTGDYDIEDNRANYADIIVATNEKIDSGLRHKSKWLSKVGLVISDEVHLINSMNRGPTLEVVLAQLKRNPEVQVIALSATIRNADELSRWLEANLVSSTWRPVELHEGVIYRNTIIYKGLKNVSIPSTYKDTFLNLLDYVLKKKYQTLVFLTTRKTAETTAKKVSSKVNKILTQKEKESLSLAATRIIKQSSGTKQAEEIAKLVQSGVAFHHAGLNPMQRRIIEIEFKKGNIKVLTSTPTLAAGINLPARFVIIKSIYRFSTSIGNHPIPVLEFKQQSGRAGRPQYDKEGDAIVVARNETEAQDLYSRYIIADTEDIESRLASEPALRRITLGQIATEKTRTIEELFDFFSDTFYGFKENPVNLSSLIKSVIGFFKEEGLIKSHPDLLLPTRFGKRVSELYIDPSSAVIIRSGLERANRMPKELVTDISILHLVCSTPDVRFITYRKPDQTPLMNFVTEHEDEILTELPSSYAEIDIFLSQLKTALVIRDWINEVPEDTILSRYGIGSGDIYNIISNAEWILYSGGELAELLGYSEIAKKIKKLHSRIKVGIKEELLDLIQIPGIGRVRARALYNNGYKSLEDLEKAKVEDLVQIPRFGKELAEAILKFVHTGETDFSLNDLETEFELESESTSSQKSLDDFF
ncbi:extensin [Candidatus Pacearchaeota archaeon]|nr:MAG: extensin [Candidatus Pacearchaeota archaeon]